MRRRERFRALHVGRALRDPESLGCRFGTGARGARLRGARDDELGARVHARPLDGGVTLDEVVAHVRRSTRRGAAALGRSRERLRRRAGARRAAIAARRRGRRRRRLDRGLRPAGRLYELAHATERIAAAVEAARAPRFRSRLRRAPRTTSAATPTSTTRSRGCRPTRRPARMCSSRPACATRRRDPRGVRRRRAPVNVLAHPRADDRARSSPRARSASASAARSPGVRGGDGHRGRPHPRLGDFSVLGARPRSPTGSRTQLVRRLRRESCSSRPARSERPTSHAGT